MKDSQDDWNTSSGVRPPTILSALVFAAWRRISHKPIVDREINWRETASDLFARFLVGLVCGAALCVFLFPFLFWPGRTPSVSLFESIGKPAGIGLGFLGIFFGSGLVGALTTRVKHRETDLLDVIHFQSSGVETEERVKTGCIGLLLPLATVAFGYRLISHPNRPNRFTGTPSDPQDMIALGIAALGIALCVHAFGFVPYDRIPVFKYLLALAGVVLFFMGLNGAFR